MLNCNIAGHHKEYCHNIHVDSEYSLYNNTLSPRKSLAPNICAVDNLLLLQSICVSEIMLTDLGHDFHFSDN